MKSQLLREYEQRMNDAWRAMNEAKKAVDAEYNAWKAESEAMGATLLERIRLCQVEGKERAESHAERHKRLSADDCATVTTPFGRFPAGADGITAYFFSTAPKKTVAFNRSIYFI